MKKRDYTLEVCCGSIEDVITAVEAGADRIELCSALDAGGLTASYGTTKTALEIASDKTKIVNIIRPREGGFVYTNAEYQVAFNDAKTMLELGADGIVFGFLDENSDIDIAKTQEFVNLAGDKETCFHRAFDEVRDWREAIDQLVELGVDRILTSAQRSSVLNGLDTLKEMQEYANGRIQIMAGAGVVPEKIDEIIEISGVENIHGTFSKKVYVENKLRGELNNAASQNDLYSYKVVDKDLLNKIGKFG